MTRRVITGKNKDGKSVFFADGVSPRETALTYTPGFAIAPLWMTGAIPSLPYDGKDPMAVSGSLIQPPGGSVFMTVTFPPDAVYMSPDFRPDLAGPEQGAACPGIAETFEMDNPGMHTTPTLDYAVVLSGKVTLELDDGAVTHLEPGDTVVQIGARHAWRNPNSEPATLAFVLMGART